MTSEEKLYEVLGELLYVIAIADGVIQPEERDTLKSFVKNHEHGEVIKWSFEYEEDNNSTIEETYKKVINFCHGFGATSIYNEFIEAMQAIAKAADGISSDESELINSFSRDLIARFQKDAEELIKYQREEREGN